MKENPDIKVSVEAVGDEPIKDKLRIDGTDNQPDVFHGQVNLPLSLSSQIMH